MKKTDALKAFDTWLEGTKEDLILEEFYCSVPCDKRLESLKVLRRSLSLSDSPLAFADTLVCNLTQEARTSGFIRVLFKILLAGQEWESD